MNLISLPEVSSTNDFLKDLARQGAPQGTAVLAERQTGGRGRRGRSFQSPDGMGVYLSYLLRPGCRPEELMHLTCAVGVAMCDAVERTALFRPGIKWTNDIVHGKKKLGGILTELDFTSQGLVDCAIVGIGINCRQQAADFSPDLRDMAASLAMVTGKDVDRNGLVQAMLESLEALSGTLLSQKDAILARYRRDCVTLGRDISLLRGDEVRHGRALDIDGEGALLVEFADGRREAVSAGEVSVRGMYGYL